MTMTKLRKLLFGQAKPIQPQPQEKRYIINNVGKLVLVDAKDVPDHSKVKINKKRSIIGMFEDCPDLIDEITEDAMKDRETMPWRTPEDE